MRTRRMCRIALMAALLCIASPVAIPVGAVPVTLATFFVCLAGLCFGPREGAAAVGVYLLLGAAGLPVFSGFRGGFGALLGPTGGYLWGYLPCVMITGLGRDGRRSGLYMALGMFVCYAVGTAWFMAQSQTTLAGALSACVLPFLSGDVLKGIAAQSVAQALRRRLK